MEGNMIYIFSLPTSFKIGGSVVEQSAKKTATIAAVFNRNYRAL
jgi:hypothetical protein